MGIKEDEKSCVEEEAKALINYRTALGYKEKEILDRLILLARNHAAACAKAGTMNLVESMLLAIVIEQQKTIERLAASG